MPSADLGEAELAIGERLAGDPTFRALVGIDEADEPRVYGEYPAELLERPIATEFPRWTFLRQALDIEAPGFGTVRIQSDGWALDDATRRALSRRAIELLDGQSWIHLPSGARINVVHGGSGGDSVFKAAELRIYRRSDDWDVLVSG